MADRQYRPLGTENAPAGWTLPAGLSITPKLAYASFDGSAAAQFVPCLRLISDSGDVAAEYVSPTTVAAGASADVTWFRGVSGGSSGSSTGGSLPFAKASPAAFVTVPAISGGTPGTVVFDMELPLDYNGDSSVFAATSAVSGGNTIHGIGVLVPGHYLVKAQIIVQGISATGLIQALPLNLSNGTPSAYGSAGREWVRQTGETSEDGLYVEALITVNSGDGPFPTGPFTAQISNSGTATFLADVDIIVERLDTSGTHIA